ncbi:M15 family metallopeptidase [Dysgonomonas sp. BGC7]|uniref:M15 family metallopeptidase n=1 Tax=Dysgonomonas sp. BGC7 TaxID=1658008 RepID=UPI00068315AF|nr:M15 family metallopeptidase [Dysgonomonas sp. BGC7]MBD8390259.1 M15 family metallopeptidase [Dysgonomonas sp. BGC7]
MNKLKYVLILILAIGTVKAQEVDVYPSAVKKLLRVYPLSIISFDGTHLIMDDGSRVKYEKSVGKAHKDLIKSDLVEDMFVYKYEKGVVKDLPKNHDPGRIRSEILFKRMYGATSEEVQKHLVTIVWCPNLINQNLKISQINGVDKQLQKVSDELDKHTELRDYLYSAGTFNWREVRGANRLSPHSYGIAIDLNVKYSNFWQWDCHCKAEDADLIYKNRIPQLIVDIFEKYGFIWGGKWYHYDTMHFEYRPELLLEEKE